MPALYQIVCAILPNMKDPAFIPHLVELHSVIQSAVDALHVTQCMQPSSPYVAHALHVYTDVYLPRVATRLAGLCRDRSVDGPLAELYVRSDRPFQDVFAALSDTPELLLQYCEAALNSPRVALTPEDLPLTICDAMLQLFYAHCPDRFLDVVCSKRSLVLPATTRVRGLGCNG